MSVSHKSRLFVDDYYTHTNADNISTPTDQKEYQYTLEFANGSGDSQAQDMWRSQRTVLANDYDSIDFAGSLTDVFGNTLTFTKIKQILIVSTSTTDGDDIEVGGQHTATGGNLMSELFSGQTDSSIRVKAGGIFLIACPYTGYTVTGGSADVLLVKNVGTNSVTYEIIVKGIRT